MPKQIRGWCSSCLVLLLPVLPLHPSVAEPVINEFLAANDSIHPDNCDFEDYSDWIELSNPGSAEVSLAGHYLTDDLAEPFKWPFPAGAVIPARGYLMVRADGWNAGPGETHLRGYWPWDSTLVTRRYHASFKLSAEGEAVGLYRTDQPPQDVILIPAGATWRYRDTGTDPGPDWMRPGYDDQGWATGAAPLGYGEGDESTVVSYGPNGGAKYPATHFRCRFPVTDPARLGHLRLRVIVDDGAVLYLNGVEFARLRLPAGKIAHTDFATGQPGAEDTWEPVEVPRALFRPGENILAAEVHQASAGSSDLRWQAELEVAVILGPPRLVDAVTFGPQLPDVSYGRNPQGGWAFFGSPTPEGPNLTEPLTQLAYAPPVESSLPSGFYDLPPTLVLTAPPAADAIRYTLDGSPPTLASPRYEGALTFTTNTVLRARTYQPGLIPGPVLTRTIFVKEVADRTLPVMSVVADPETLFGPVIGIYSNSTAYAHKGREIPAHAEFFPAPGAPGFAVNCGLRIGGEIIWQYAQKPLNLHLRGKYGDDVIAYPVFPGEAVGMFGRLNLRNGGSNWAKDMLRDALLAPVLRGQAEHDLSSYRPCVVFVNGRYWGIHNLRKQFDPVFFANEHHLAEGDYDLLQYARDGRGIIQLMAEAGTTESYEAFHEFYTTRDFSQPAEYAALQARMNVDSFIDFVVASDFGVNGSWGHNREFWCARAPGSRWHWNVPDFDRCFDAPNLQGSLIGYFRTAYPLFHALSRNPQFLHRLLQRYAAHLASTWHPQRVAAILDGLAAEVDSEIPRHIARWAPYGGMPSLARRQVELNEIKQFVADRPGPALSRLQSELGLDRGLATLALTLSPAAGGNVRVAGVPLTPEYTTTLNLFRNTPVELTAEAAPGYTFAGWSHGDPHPTIEITLAADLAITARFEPGGETLLPAQLTADTHLSAAGSPYTVPQDLVVPPHVTLTLGPGVRLLMPPGGSLYVQGALQINGRPDAPVEFAGRDHRPWGNLAFVHATGPSVLSHFTLRGATRSRQDPVNLRAAISAYDSDLTIEQADLEAWFPLFTRFGALTLRHSRVHIRFTGDGVNVKSGAGAVEHCTFTGAPTPDTDGIDFDAVTNGVIRGNRIYGFAGPNSDAIDVGEGCQGLLIISNRVFHIFDKGISVGQASTARIERNLIVGCQLGVGVKDTGSTAWLSQNTFAQNDVGVAAYEKNRGHGGGAVEILHCIFSRSKTAPVTADALSRLSTRYSLSDTLSLPGIGNLLADPLFQDAGAYDFSLAPASPARNAGDPAQPPDPDGSRADLGAYYAFDPDDFPHLAPNVVVVNEVLAHSHSGPDWIELHNRSLQPVDLSGWYLSDDAAAPRKYRIADGTILPGQGYLVFDQARHFGAGSSDPGALIPFALSEHGEEVSVFGPGNGQRADYLEIEDFGASASDVTFGRHYKASTRTYNFVGMATPTPGSPNSAPRVGPVVIAEIMYHPPVGDAEYLELANITSAPVTLWDEASGAPWKFTQGLSHTFPAAPPLTLAPGEIILLARDPDLLLRHYPPAPGTRVFPWTSGGLDNGGETLELARPGDTDDRGVLRYIRVDRVDYSDAAPWPTGPDGQGTSLRRIHETAYGNDVANWTESNPTPGLTGYPAWQTGYAFPAGQDVAAADPDADGLANGTEYALGTHPLQPSTLEWNLALLPEGARVSFSVGTPRPEATYLIQRARDSRLSEWVNLDARLLYLPGPAWELAALDTTRDGASFYRFAIVLPAR